MSDLLNDNEEPETEDAEETYEPQYADGEEVEPEVEETEEEAVETEPEETAEVSPTTSDFRAAPMQLQDLTAMREKFSTDFGPDVASSIRDMVTAELRQAQQAQAIAHWHLSEMERDNPEFFRVHRASINATLASLPIEQQGQPQTVALVALGPVIQELMANPRDLKGVIERAHKLVTGQAAKQQSRPAVKPTVSNASRVASSGTGAIRPTAPRTAMTDEQRIMDLYGITKSQAREFMDNQ